LLFLFFKVSSTNYVMPTPQIKNVSDNKCRHLILYTTLIHVASYFKKYHFLKLWSMSTCEYVVSGVRIASFLKVKSFFAAYQDQIARTLNVWWTNNYMKGWITSFERNCSSKGCNFLSINQLLSCKIIRTFLKQLKPTKCMQTPNGY
jgi:hypothetical protein